MAEEIITSTKKDTNNLFPVFLKLEHLRLLIVGGGATGLEKLNAVISNSPATRIKIVAAYIREEIIAVAEKHPAIELLERAYAPEDLHDVDLVIVAVDDKQLSFSIQQDAKEKGVLINVAD